MLLIDTPTLIYGTDPFWQRVLRLALLWKWGQFLDELITLTPSRSTGSVKISSTIKGPGTPPPITIPATMYCLDVNVHL